MKAGVDLAEAAQLDSGVNLRCGDRRVTEHLLDGAEIGSSGEQMGGEAVPQRVRADVAVQAGCRACRLTIARAQSATAAGPIWPRTPSRSPACGQRAPAGPGSR